MRANHQPAPSTVALQGLASAPAKATTRTVELHTKHCALRFHLQRVTGGLYVERETIARRGLSLQQSVLLPDLRSSAQWCDADPVRFDHPLLHTQLRRAADELWTTPATQSLG